MTPTDTLSLISKQSDALSHIFGEGSRLLTPSSSELVDRGLNADPYFQILTLIVMILYLIQLIYNKRDTVEMLRYISVTQKSKVLLSRRIGEAGRSRRMRTLVLLWGFSVGIFVVGAISQVEDLDLGEGGGALLALGVAGALAVVYLIQSLVLMFVGWMSYMPKIAKSLIIVKSSYTMLLSLFVVPVILLAALGFGVESRILLYVALFEVFVLLFLFVRETLFLFIDKKISILHWFLYLCTVEALPLSFIVVITIKYLLV